MLLRLKPRGALGMGPASNAIARASPPVPAVHGSDPQSLVVQVVLRIGGPEPIEAVAGVQRVGVVLVVRHTQIKRMLEAADLPLTGLGQRALPTQLTAATGRTRR